MATSLGEINSNCGSQALLDESVQISYVEKMSIIPKKSPGSKKKFKYDLNPTHPPLFPSTTLYHLSHPLNTPHLSSFLLLFISVPVLVYLGIYLPSYGPTLGVAVVTFSILWENFRYLQKIKWILCTVFILSFEVVFWGYFEDWEPLNSLEFAMSIVWLILMTIFGVSSKIFSDREKSMDKLWEDGGWKRKSSGSWNLWNEHRSQEEQFEAALKQEATILAQLKFLQASKEF